MEVILRCCVGCSVNTRWTLLLCGAGDHIRRTMLQVGSALEPVEYVEGILGKGHLHSVGCGHKPQIDSLLRELGIS